MKNRNPILTAILSALTCFAFLQQTQAVEPATPDPGPRPSTNTADGQAALFSLTTGLYNSAFGFDSLLSNSTSNFNTGVGAGTLLLDNGDPTVGEGVRNTAVGAGALLDNTTGGSNTAVGT